MHYKNPVSDLNWKNSISGHPITAYISCYAAAEAVECPA